MEDYIKEKLDKAYSGSWYTITGCVLEDIDEYKKYYENALLSDGIGEIKEWAVITGKEMNEYSNLTGTNAYKDDLNCLVFSLDGLNIEKLALLKIFMGDRWFDDIVDNDRRIERGEDDYGEDDSE